MQAQTLAASMMSFSLQAVQVASLHGPGILGALHHRLSTLASKILAIKLFEQDLNAPHTGAWCLCWQCEPGQRQMASPGPAPPQERQCRELRLKVPVCGMLQSCWVLSLAVGVYSREVVLKLREFHKQVSPQGFILGGAQSSCKTR